MKNKHTDRALKNGQAFPVSLGFGAQRDFLVLIWSCQYLWIDSDNHAGQGHGCWSVNLSEQSLVAMSSLS